MSPLRWQRTDMALCAFSGEMMIAQITGPHTQKRPRRFRKKWCREDIGTRSHDNSYFTEEAARASVEATWDGWLKRASLTRVA